MNIIMSGARSFDDAKAIVLVKLNAIIPDNGSEAQWKNSLIATAKAMTEERLLEILPVEGNGGLDNEKRVAKDIGDLMQQSGGYRKKRMQSRRRKVMRRKQSRRA